MLKARNNEILQAAFIVLLVMVVIHMPAFGAETAADWTQPATKLLSTLESGLVKIGAVVVGLGVIAVGILAAAMGKMEWSRVVYVVIGGVLVMAGPTALRTLLKVTAE